MSSSGFGTKVQHKVEETFEAKVEDQCETKCEPKCEQKEQCRDTGLIIAAIVLALIWTFAIYAVWSFCSASKNSNSGCGIGSNCIGAFLIWLLFIIIFFASIYAWGWSAVVGILVFFLVVMLLGWWASCAC